MRRLVVVGSANLDLVSRVERMPRTGETVLALATSRNSGGKGANQAIAAARAGAPTSFVAALGEDAEAEALLADLVGAGVTSRVRRTAEPTGTASITVDAAGGNTIVVASGANATLAALADAEREEVAGASHLLLQLESPLTVVVEAARVAHEAGGMVVLNAAPMRPLPAELLEAVDLLVVNEHEAAELLRLLDADAGLACQEDWVVTAAVLLVAHVPAVVVTHGEHGAVLHRRDMAAPQRIPAFPAAAVDTTGAGDTFCGALTAGLVSGLALPEAARYATAAASLSVRVSGAVPSIPGGEAIRELLATAG